MLSDTLGEPTDVLTVGLSACLSPQNSPLTTGHTLHLHSRHIELKGGETVCLPDISMQSVRGTDHVLCEGWKCHVQGDVVEVTRDSNGDARVLIL